MQDHSSKSWLQRLLHALSGEPHDREELLSVLQHASNRQLLNHDALHMIEGVLKISEMQARDVMIPRGQMVVIEADMAIDTIVSTLVESGHSRFPVIGENADEILGVLLAKDLLQHLYQSPQTPVPLQSILRSATFIPESKRLDVLLREFRQDRAHMAIVVDEYGGTAGLITIEDVLELIVGDIEDETDTASEEPNIQPQPDGSFLVNALTSIDEFNTEFDAALNDENFDTLCGFVTQYLGHLPKVGESCTTEGFTFTIYTASRRQ